MVLVSYEFFLLSLRGVRDLPFGVEVLLRFLFILRAEESLMLFFFKCVLVAILQIGLEGGET